MVILALGWIILWFSSSKNFQTEVANQESAFQSLNDGGQSARGENNNETWRDTFDGFDSFSRGIVLEMVTLGVD
jgi:hypothetical protein